MYFQSDIFKLPFKISGDSEYSEESINAAAAAINFNFFRKIKNKQYYNFNFINKFIAGLYNIYIYIACIKLTFKS